MEEARGGNTQERGLARIGIALAAFSERWFPDSFVFALIAVLVVMVLGCILAGHSFVQMSSLFGSGFWDLFKFTMQTVLIIVTGYVVASSPPVYRLITRMAAIPTTPSGAIAFIAVFSMLSSLLSWSFSLIFSGLLTREICHRVRGLDYRAAGAAAYLGLGSIWALGVSSSAALLMGSASALPPPLLKISGVISHDQTIMLWQSEAMALVLMAASVLVAVASLPSPAASRDAVSMQAPYQPLEIGVESADRPGEWLETTPWLTIGVGAMCLVHLWVVLVDKGVGALLDLDNYVFAFLLAGLLLHWHPRSFVKAVGLSVSAAGGVLVQYPFYAGIMKMITGSGLSEILANFFVRWSSHDTFPVVVGMYSAVLGMFIPSAGGKWLTEAPYLMEAGKQLHVHLGWIVQTYNATEALPNLIHPFWMLPLIGILGLRARDIVGFTALQFVVHVPLVLFMVWVFNLTLPYVPPVLSS